MTVHDYIEDSHWSENQWLDKSDSSYNIIIWNCRINFIKIIIDNYKLFSLSLSLILALDIYINKKCEYSSSYSYLTLSYYYFLKAFRFWRRLLQILIIKMLRYNMLWIQFILTMLIKTSISLYSYIHAVCTAIIMKTDIFLYLLAKNFYMRNILFLISEEWSWLI